MTKVKLNNEKQMNEARRMLDKYVMSFDGGDFFQNPGFLRKPYYEIHNKTMDDKIVMYRNSKSFDIKSNSKDRREYLIQKIKEIKNQN